MFTNETAAQTEEIVSDTFARTLFDGGTSTTTTKVMRFVANSRDRIPATITSLEDTVRLLRKSITVRRLNLVQKEDIGTGNGKPSPAWNVYMLPPTDDHDALFLWRDFIRKLKFVTDANKAGYTYKIFRCKVCRSEDHPSGMCPFPSQPEWVERPSGTSPALASILNVPQPHPEHTPRTSRGRPSSNRRGGGHRGRGSRNPQRA